MPMLRFRVAIKPPSCAHQPAGWKPQAAERSRSERGVKSRMWPEGFELEPFGGGDTR